MLVLTDGERGHLQRWARRASTAQALRSRIVSGCAAGGSNRQVAAELRLTESTVARWRRRVVEQRLAGLVDEPRPGRPPSILLDQVEDVVITTLEQTPPNATHWSRTSMAKRTRLSRGMIGRIWGKFELKPHRHLLAHLDRRPAAAPATARQRRNRRPGRTMDLRLPRRPRPLRRRGRGRTRHRCAAPVS
ncbi:helix-turn-helix domain-containing protein [Nocardia takedensis]|uniref:helix-turn-helix domain-containing protein n=1 Tax=Nocardia takedensis TaxID=259390 RepID=UPI003F777123